MYIHMYIYIYISRGPSHGFKSLFCRPHGFPIFGSARDILRPPAAPSESPGRRLPLFEAPPGVRCRTSSRRISREIPRFCWGKKPLPVGFQKKISMISCESFFSKSLSMIQVKDQSWNTSPSLIAKKFTSPIPEKTSTSSTVANLSTPERVETTGHCGWWPQRW